jgi:hypothetical protein
MAEQPQPLLEASIIASATRTQGGPASSLTIAGRSVSWWP